MKAVIVQEDKMVKVEERPIPTLNPNEILLKTKTISLNPGDWKTLKFVASPGSGLGCDAVGEVVKLGSDVPFDRVKVGELRWSFVLGALGKGGGAFAEFVAVDWDVTSIVPPNISADEAASIPATFFTAVQCVYLRLGIPEPPAKINGEWILIWSGNTAVGRFAIQLAKLSGLKVATTASRNFDRLKDLGADVIVNYKDTDVVEKLKAGTGDSIVYGIDTIVENGSIQLAQKAFSPKGGHLVCINFDLGTPARDNVKTEATSVVTLYGPGKLADNFVIPVDHNDRASFVRWAKLAPELFAKGEVKPLVVENIGGLEDVGNALDKLMKGENKEKMVATIA